MQLNTMAGTTSAIVVSTIMEAWEVVRSGLVADGTVKDVGFLFCFCFFLVLVCDPLQILYGLPVGLNKVADLAVLMDTLALHDGVFRVLVDNIAQIQVLEAFNLERDRRIPWSVFVKVECGGRLAFGLLFEKCVFTMG